MSLYNCFAVDSSAWASSHAICHIICHIIWQHKVAKLKRKVCKFNDAPQWNENGTGFKKHIYFVCRLKDKNWQWGIPRGTGTGRGGAGGGGRATFFYCAWKYFHANVRYYFLSLGQTWYSFLCRGRNCKERREEGKGRGMVCDRQQVWQDAGKGAGKVSEACLLAITITINIDYFC